MRSAAPRVLLVLAVASLLGLFSALLAYSFRLASSEPVSWWHTFPLNLAYWWAWAALTPFVFWMARRFRFGRRAIWRPLLAHLPAAALTSLVHVMTLSLVRGALTGRLSWARWLSDVRSSYWMSVDWEMVTYWALVGTSHALHYYFALRQREIAAAQLEARLAEARLQGLQRQLHPHFLFNTLHGISALMHRDLAAADRMLALLGDLLRSSLKVTAQEISLKDELDLLGKYLEIEQIRFRDRLTVTYDIPGETLDARVPSLVLQPLAENAIDHGIAPTAGHGRLEIWARRHGSQLWLEVRDNGVGLRGDTQAGDLVTASGIGVSNTRSRLQCLYGAAHQFEFCRVGQRGLTVRLVIPWREAPPAAAVPAVGELAS